MLLGRFEISEKSRTEKNNGLLVCVRVIVFVGINIYIYMFTLCIYIYICGPGSSVGIATDYELDGPGWNPGGDEIVRSSRPALVPTQPPVKCVPGLCQG